MMKHHIFKSSINNISKQSNVQYHGLPAAAAGASIYRMQRRNSTALNRYGGNHKCKRRNTAANNQKNYIRSENREFYMYCQMARL